MENGGLGQSITAPLCLSFPLTHFPCSNVDPPWATVPSGHTHLIRHGPLHGLQCEYLLHHSLSTGSIGISTLAPGASLTLPSALTLGFSGQVFTFFFPHSTLPSSVFHFLKYTFPQRHHHLGCGAQPCLGLSSQRPPCSSHYPPLGTCTP